MRDWLPTEYHGMPLEYLRQPIVTGMFDQMYMNPQVGLSLNFVQTPAGQMTVVELDIIFLQFF